MRFFLAAHRDGDPRRSVPEPCFLRDPPAALQHLDLPLDLVLERLLQEAERVQVLDFGLGPERIRPSRAHRDVRVAAQASLLHVAVVDAKPDENRAQPCEEFGGVGRRPQVGLRHDLDERRAAAVVVDVGLAVGIDEALVQRLAGVFLEVDAGDAHAPGPAAGLELERPLARQRPFVLRDLIALRQIGIEVVLAREDRQLVDAAAERQTRADAELDGHPIEDRERSRKTQADGADVRVRRRAECGAAAAENLGSGEELGVDFQADDWLVGDHVCEQGPAARTAADTPLSKTVKLAANICASRAAC